MPKVNLGRNKSAEILFAEIHRVAFRLGVHDSDLLSGKTRQTFCNRKKNPDSFTLGELRSILRNSSDETIIKIIRG